MAEPTSQDTELVEAWQRFVQGLLGVIMLVGAGFMAHYYAPPETTELQQQVRQLSRQVEALQQQDSFPAAAVDNSRESVAYVAGIYRITEKDGREIRARVAGTGFVVAPGLLATNRHVAEPWYGDREAEAALKRGATPLLECLVAYFPGSAAPVNLRMAAMGKHGDLAVLHMGETAFTAGLHPLKLARTQAHVGEAVSVLAYPMGVTGMVAKSPAVIYERLSTRRETSSTAGELAALALIRPSATFGHIGDVTADKLIYDAPTARGGSGGPVLNARGEVVGINTAYLDGFSGGTLGSSAAELVPLIESAQQTPVEAAEKSQ